MISRSYGYRQYIEEIQGKSSYLWLRERFSKELRLVLLFRSGLEKWVIFENPEREREPRKSVSREQRLRQ